MKVDVVFAGIGGQGIVGASDVLCEAALMDGFNVAKSEIHGVVQRGGSIVAHVRIGDGIVCPLIERGAGDIILGFEIIESARALPMLKDEGRVIVNKEYLPPTPVLQGQVEPPRIDVLVDMMRLKASRIYEIDGLRLAGEAGDVLSRSVVLLGALLAAVEEPFREESVRNALLDVLGKEHLDVNLKALQLGRESVQNSKTDFNQSIQSHSVGALVPDPLHILHPRKVTRGSEWPQAH